MTSDNKNKHLGVMIIDISKTFFIKEEHDEETDIIWYCVYAREVEPYKHTSHCWSYKCYYDACDYAIEQATELNEEIL